MVGMINVKIDGKISFLQNGDKKTINKTNTLGFFLFEYIIFSSLLSISTKLLKHIFLTIFFVWSGGTSPGIVLLVNSDVVVPALVLYYWSILMWWSQPWYCITGQF